MKSTKQGKVVFNMFSVTRLLICIKNNVNTLKYQKEIESTYDI